MQRFSFQPRDACEASLGRKTPPSAMRLFYAHVPYYYKKKQNGEEALTSLTQTVPGFVRNTCPKYGYSYRQMISIRKDTGLKIKRQNSVLSSIFCLLLLLFIKGINIIGE